jgi:hypothetical protein
MRKNTADLMRLLVVLSAMGGAIAVLIIRPYAQENEVLLALVQSWGTPEALDGAVFLSYPNDCTVGPASKMKVSSELMSAFLEANSDGSPAIRLSGLEKKYNVISFEFAEKVRETEGAALAFVELGKRVAKLSRVGFYEEQALVCVEAEGAGELYLLQRAQGEWRIVGQELVWIS